MYKFQNSNNILFVKSSLFTDTFFLSKSRISFNLFALLILIFGWL